jgi:4-hydroxy-tetrahydrodipicolinate synthase
VTLFDAMLLSADFPEGFRAALRLRGIEPGESRQPYSAEQQLKMETISVPVV